MAKEIAKQAAIFANSTFAGTWLNEIEDWTGTQNSLAWLSVRYLSNTSWGSEFPLGADPAATIMPPLSIPCVEGIDMDVLGELASHSPKLLGPGYGGDSLPGWFTSL
jgi:hypothetical protein